MSKKDDITRRGLLGSILAGVAGLEFGKKLSSAPAILWEEPEDDSDCPPLDEEDDDEDRSTSTTLIDSKSSMSSMNEEASSASSIPMANTIKSFTRVFSFGDE